MNAVFSWRELGRILWPAFLTAAVLQILVFGFVDPQDLHKLLSPVIWSRQGVYTLAFFSFWAVTAGGCFLTWLLTRSPEQKLD